MSEINRPVAETIIMLLSIIAHTPPHLGLKITTQTGRDLNGVVSTHFSEEGCAYVRVVEPTFDQLDYEGIEVTFFFRNGKQANTNKYRGTNIANIAPDIYRFLAHQAG